MCPSARRPRRHHDHDHRVLTNRRRRLPVPTTHRPTAGSEDEGFALVLGAAAAHPWRQIGKPSVPAVCPVRSTARVEEASEQHHIPQHTSNPTGLLQVDLILKLQFQMPPMPTSPPRNTLLFASIMHNIF
jgi:hypothetical protein